MSDSISMSSKTEGIQDISEYTNNAFVLPVESDSELATRKDVKDDNQPDKRIKKDRPETNQTDETVTIGKYISIKKWHVFTVIKILLFLLYLAYFIYCMTVEIGSEESWRLVWCTILGLFIYSTRFLKRTRLCKSWKALQRTQHFKSGSRLRLVIRW